MNTHRCRLLLVDDHERTREALRNLLASHDHLEVIAEAGDGEEAIIRVASCEPEIIVRRRDAKVVSTARSGLLNRMVV